jgi:hypothetical protein
MKQIKYSLISLSAAFFLYSCCKKDTYTYLDSKKKLIYELGDTLVYMDKVGFTDTFFLTKIEQHFVPTTYNSDNCNSAQYNEALSYCFDTIQKEGNKTSFITVNYSGSIDMYWLDARFDSKIEEDFEIIDSINLNNQDYYHIFKINTGFKNNKIVTVYYQDQLGIICYIASDNNIWNLINKHLQNP